ncbi:MAG: SMI1/KNR4 family protein [Defluviitaleaceae bacterium]|nr:SMI1/KNR4 family protein [Defluviitaleaceae bacterium]
MSYINFEKALELAKKCEGYYISGGRDEELIRESEKLLNIKFSKQSKAFYKKVGYLSFFGEEIYGIYPLSNSGILAGNSVASTLHDREKYNLPENLVVVYHFGFDGLIGFLDYSQLNENGEPPVVLGFYNGEKWIIEEKLAEDLGDFILELAEEALSEQENGQNQL